MTDAKASRTPIEDEQRAAAALDYLATIGAKVEEIGDRSDWQGIVTLWPVAQVPSSLRKEEA